jgi:hypothetical protein
MKVLIPCASFNLKRTAKSGLIPVYSLRQMDKCRHRPVFEPRRAPVKLEETQSFVNGYCFPCTPTWAQDLDVLGNQ